MAGCFGNSKEDRFMESQLDKYLDSQEIPDYAIDFDDCEDLEVDDVDAKDYPDFCDAFFSSGTLYGVPLTEDQLTYLNETYPENLSEMALQSLT